MVRVTERVLDTYYARIYIGKVSLGFLFVRFITHSIAKAIVEKVRIRVFWVLIGSILTWLTRCRFSEDFRITFHPSRDSHFTQTS